jgi:hypothetical protein
MRGKIMYLGILLLVSALAISGCSGASSALEPTPAGQSSRPSDPVGARDAVLAYLAAKDGSGAPAAGLAWTETHTKPEGLVGGESYEYTAGDWLIAVSYPVVAPESIVYTIRGSSAGSAPASTAHPLARWLACWARTWYNRGQPLPVDKVLHADSARPSPRRPGSRLGRPAAAVHSQ